MFIVMEVQTSTTIATIVTSYTNRDLAESKYHQILTSAAVSNVPRHSAVLMDLDGNTLKNETYIHEEIETNEG